MKVMSLCFVVTAILMACQTSSYTAEGGSGSSQLVASTTELSITSGQQGAAKSAMPVTYQQQQFWLLTSETEGIRLVDSTGHILSTFAGNMELVDWRDNIQIAAQNYGLIATVDNNLGQVLILALDWQNKQLSLLHTLGKTSAQIETLCWYKKPQGHLSLFTADAVGMIEQRIIVDRNRHLLVDESVHQFIGAPQTKSCAVDDVSGALYVVEENIGVWRYAADPESELARELVTAVMPFGPLAGEVTHVDVLENGELLVSTPEQQGVWHIANTEQATATFIQLAGTEKPEVVHAHDNSTGLVLGVVDDESGVYLHSQVTFDVTPRAPSSNPIQNITAYAQTKPVDAYGDAADDPAIWLNVAKPEQSRILGTNKKQGLMLYDLQGQLLQQLNVGRVNNVDLRYGFKLGNNTFDLAAASNRSSNSISLFSIHSDSGELAFLSDIATDLGDVYGLCMYQDKEQYYVFINDTAGRYQQYLLVTVDNKIEGKLVREFQVPSQPEGCVADDASQQLYYGEESTGIWQVTAQPVAMPAKLIATTSETFVADVEGMEIYQMDGKRYLVASSQGNNSYGVFALEQDNRYLGSFRIDMDLQARVDGVSETDGLAITSQALGANLPDGLLVVQDGRNRLPVAPQNFKLVDGKWIKQLLNQWLQDK
ncbi:phytase [Paraglaciecola aquimarina]|uniref:Phytase n=1 Tax=Paraglaciecola aquimarina TaxID=1235557 RepID=A0ABU3SZG4_9ALTE|nr:phytase [Paraglaciecola aquimarina]MDU0355402.1 phytase [Paraglaciecola aquimarina]